MRPRHLDAVEADVDPFIVETHQAGDRQQRGQGEIVGPRKVGVRGVADAHRPVVRGPPLVRAGRFGIRVEEMAEVDAGAIEVVAGGQAGLEDEHRRVRLGEQHAVEADPDVAGGAQRIHADIWVAGMDEHLLVLLVPRVQRGPVEADRVRDTFDRVGAEHPRRARPFDVSDSYGVQRSPAAGGAVRRTVVDEYAGRDVVERDVELRVGRPLPHVARAGRVEQRAPGEHRAHPARHRLDMVARDGRQRVVDWHVRSVGPSLLSGR